MEEYQECIGNLKAIVMNVRDDLKHQRITESAALQQLGVIRFRAELAKREMMKTHAAARAIFS